jgi:hypothetical protein
VKPDQRFQRQPKHFWANVRTISQKLGYTERGEGVIKVPSLGGMQKALGALGLHADHILDARGEPTALGQGLHDYFRFRADVLNQTVEPLLMTVGQAAKLFAEHKRRLCPTCPIPMNKQKGKKKTVAYFTGLINMLIEANAKGYPCDFDPRALTTITVKDAPLRTLARRVDGAFPRAVNPVAVWEISDRRGVGCLGEGGRKRPSLEWRMRQNGDAPRGVPGPNASPWFHAFWAAPACAGLLA